MNYHALRKPVHGLRVGQRARLGMSRSGKETLAARYSRVVDESDPVRGGYAAIDTPSRTPMRNRTLEFHVDLGRPANGPAHGLVAGTRARIACGGSGAPAFTVGDLMSFGHDRLHFLRHEPAAS